MPALHKEWDEALCPICMDHPHNAVLIICSSHKKGCRPFICDTSYRHSNCLDRFKKLKQETVETSFAASSMADNDHVLPNSSTRNMEFGGHGGTLLVEPNSGQNNVQQPMEKVLSLKCPLCRGVVLSWKVVEDARKYLNMKSRSCSHESCPFTGNYGELRRHARRDHPLVRPADVDPSRQREWHRLEDQRELNDIVSAIRSAMPGATFVGDYAVESGDRPFGERVRSGSSVDRSRWMSTLFLFHMIGSLEEGAPRRGGRSRRVLERRNSIPASRRTHRYLWGERLLGLEDVVIEEEDEDEEEEEDGAEDDEQDLNVPSDLGYHRRRRPRFSHHRSNRD